MTHILLCAGVAYGIVGVAFTLLTLIASCCLYRGHELAKAVWYAPVIGITWPWLVFELCRMIACGVEDVA